MVKTKDYNENTISTENFVLLSYACVYPDSLVKISFYLELNLIFDGLLQLK
jgi:hypothetical protein